MSVRIDVEYLGDLRSRATHGPSGCQLETVPLPDTPGDASYFGPTDLAATSLGACVLTTMGVVARRREVDMTGAHVVVEKDMTTTGPRRIARMAVTVTMPQGIAPEHRSALEAAARGCPVHRSLHPDVDAPITIHWEE